MFRNKGQKSQTFLLEYVIKLVSLVFLFRAVCSKKLPVLKHLAGIYEIGRIRLKLHCCASIIDRPSVAGAVLQTAL